MKKLILLLALAFVMCGCEEYNSRGPKMPFTVTKGSIRTTETSDYIATEVCINLEGIDRRTPVWKLESVQKKK